MERFLALALAGSLVACSGRVELDQHHELGEPLVIGHLAVWPVFPREEPEDPGHFLTLAEAQETGLAEVREADEARVDTLILENRSTWPILVCAGTVVKGGKQDRQIGRDFVVEAGNTRSIRAFCVEQRRWGGSTNNFVKTMPTMALRSVRVHGYRNDQSEVWTQTELANNPINCPSKHYLSIRSIFRWKSIWI